MAGLEEQAQELLARVFDRSVRPCPEGASEDVAAALEQTARLFARAAASGRPDLVAELETQVPLILERQRVRAVGLQARAIAELAGTATQMIAEVVTESLARGG